MNKALSIIIIIIVILIAILVPVIIYTHENWNRQITGGFGYNPNNSQIVNEYTIGYNYPTVKDDQL